MSSGNVEELVGRLKPEQLGREKQARRRAGLAVSFAVLLGLAALSTQAEDVEQALTVSLLLFAALAATPQLLEETGPANLLAAAARLVSRLARDGEVVLSHLRMWLTAIFWMSVALGLGCLVGAVVSSAGWLFFAPETSVAWRLVLGACIIGVSVAFAVGYILRLAVQVTGDIADFKGEGVVLRFGSERISRAWLLAVVALLIGTGLQFASAFQERTRFECQAANGPEGHDGKRYTCKEDTG